MPILVFADHNDGEIKSATLSTIAAGIAIGGEIHVLLAGQHVSGVARAAAEISGVTKVLVADDVAYAHGLAEDIAPLLVKLAEHYSHILAPATAFGKNIMPRVAALLDVVQISEIQVVISPNTFVRAIYAGNALATLQSNDRVKVITVRATGFEPVAAIGGSAAIETIAGPGRSGLSEFVSAELSRSERPELSSARIVISGGRGMRSGANFKLLEGVADKLNAAVGASRAAVDAGFAPNEYQVGQTGKIVAPELYIAVGISGAIQHLAGMKDSKVIVAINSDEEAPIFRVADYGIVGDLFKIIPELDAELAKGEETLATVGDAPMLLLGTSLYRDGR
jgi:electron transfer flavoprotein alpha subunit